MNLGQFLGLPMTAGPRDIPRGEDELGNILYEAPGGARYTKKTAPANKSSIVKALAGKAKANPWETIGDLVKGAAEGAWQGISAPGRALRGEPMTYGDVAATAMDWGLVNAPGLAFGKYDPANVGIFGGVNAKTADKAALARAQDMAAKGVGRDDIWTETGWFAGPDGKWRFEIDDSGARFADELATEYAADGRAYGKDTMGQVFQHQEPYSAYPGLADADVVKYPWPNPDGTKGEYRAGTKFSWGAEIPESITLWDGFGGDASTTLHEMQHAIQGREGFASGGSPRYIDNLPENPKYQNWLDNQDAVKAANDYANSPQYQADIAASNARWDDYWDPKLQELDAQRDALSGSAFEKAVDDLFAAVKAENAEMFPRLAELDRVARQYGIQEPSKTISPQDAYKRLAGEAEARNVQARRHMTAAERRATPPWNTLDVPEEDLIVRYGNGPAASIRAYHGSPHDFDRFDMSKIGTGEGAQAYGHGLYFAEAEGVAKGYREKLAGKEKPWNLRYSDRDVWGDAFYDLPPDQQRGMVELHARLSPYKDPTSPELLARTKQHLEATIQNFEGGYIPMDDGAYGDAKAALAVLNDPNFAVRPTETPGRMYEVDINADPADFLDWDAPLSEQSPKVKSFAEQRYNQFFGRPPGPDVDGEMIKRIASPQNDLDGREWLDIGPAADASKRLKEAGIPGIKYYDQGSRAGKEGTRNYVVFDDALIEILRKYGMAGAAPLGAILGSQDDEKQRIRDFLTQ